MRKRIKSRQVEASSKEIRVDWVRTHKGAFPKVSRLFCYNGKGVNLIPINNS